MCVCAQIIVYYIATKHTLLYCFCFCLCLCVLCVHAKQQFKNFVSLHVHNICHSNIQNVAIYVHMYVCVCMKG